MIVIAILIGVCIGLLANVIFPKMSATLNGVGVVTTVQNKDRRFGSASEYLHFKVLKGGKIVNKLLTEKQFGSIQDRANNNKEDFKHIK